MLKILITSYTILLSFFIEHWSSVEDFATYEVSSFGRVRNIITQKLLVPRVDKDGYEILGIYNFDNKRKYFRLHRLVAHAFILNPSELPEVNHKDLNKQNNFIFNLEWISHQDNVLHYHRIKRVDQYGHASKVA